MADSLARLGATQELCAWGLSELGGGEVCTHVEVVWVRLYQSFKVDFKVTTLGTFLAVQWLRLCTLMQGAWLQSLVRELRSRMPYGHRGGKNHDLRGNENRKIF